MLNNTYEQDYSLSELPQQILNSIQNADLPWLNSYEFCTVYNPQKAERVLLFSNLSQVKKAVFYRLTKRIGFLPILEIIGFPDIDDTIILDLLKKHKAWLAVLNRIESAVAPDEHWHSTQAHVFCNEYITIVNLPSSTEEYLNNLGKNKRKQLPQFSRRLQKHFENAIEIRYETAQDIKLNDVIELEFLNRERRAGKGKGVDSKAEIQKRHESRWSITQAHGLLITVRYHDKIMGGTLTYLHQGKAYMIVVGHNPDYENLRIGNISIWKTMDYLIENGYTELNFLWGRKQYKTQFLGIEYPWTIHILSPHKTLAMLWKYYLNIRDFYTRAFRWLKTRLGL